MGTPRMLNYLDLREAVGEIDKKLHYFEDVKSDPNSDYEQIYIMQDIIDQASIAISEANNYINATLHKRNEER